MHRLTLTSILLCLLITLTACQPAPAPQPTVTQAVALPSSTPTTRPTLTPKPTVTTTLTPTSTSTVQPAQGPVFQGSTILLRYIFGGEIFLQDIDTGEARALDRQLRIVNEDGFIGWARDGCGFYFRMRSGDIVELDLRGEIVRTVFSFDTLQTTVGEISYQSVDLSPSEEWVSYYVRSVEKIEVNGEEMNRFHPLSLMVMSTDGSRGPYVISQPGAGWNSWSDDSLRITFKDIDENGIMQVFVANFDGSNREQLTQITEADGIMRGFAQSPNNRYQVILYESSEGEYTRSIINTEKNTARDLEEAEHYRWDNDSNLMLWTEDKITWIDPDNGYTLKRIIPPEALTGYFWPYGSTGQFACLGYCIGYEREDYGFFIYAITTNTIIQYPKIEFSYELYDTGGWTITPPEFPGEAACEP